MLPYLFAPAAFLLALGITPLVRAWGQHMGWVDRPVGGRKIHRDRIVRVGGLAIWSVTVLGMVGWALLVQQGIFSDAGWRLPSVGFVLIGATIIAFLGWYDDVQPCPAWVKVSAQLAAALLMIHAGLVLQGVVNPFTGNYIAFGIAGYPLTILWVLLLINAVNLIDGMDGLAAGVTAIGITAFCATGLLPTPALVLALLLVGALFGFLKYNVSPATIFMGDIGATFIGYLLAAISLTTVAAKPTLNGLLAPIVIFGLPILDTILAFVRRMMAGRSPFSPDAEHLHHRMFRLLGKVQGRTVWAMYMIAAVLGVLGYTIAFTDPRSAFFITVGVLIAALALFVLLDFLRPSGDAPYLQQEVSPPAQLLLMPPAMASPALNPATSAVLADVLAADLDVPDERVEPDDAWEPLVVTNPQASLAVRKDKRFVEVPVTWVSLSVISE